MVEPPNQLQKAWWTAPKRGSDVHQRVTGLCDFLRKQQRDRRRANLLHMRIVATDDLTGKGQDVDSKTRAKNILYGHNERSRYMLCLSILDTAASIIASGRPTLQYLTQAGDWRTQRKAKMRTLALSGQMRHLGIEHIGPRIFRDAGTQDIGVVYGYVHPDTKKVCIERVQPNEILVDHNEALHGDPRNLYWIKPVNKERLKELYPKKAAEIERCQSVGMEDRTDYLMSRESAADSVLVYHAWHLGTSKNPGRFVMCVGKTVLVDEEYHHQEFPFAFYRYSDAPVGWYGQSLVARTKEAQRRINQLLRKYERSQDLNSKCITLVPRGSGLTPAQMNNLPGTVLETDGPRPELLTWQGTIPDLRAEIPAIREETLANEGYSEQQVQGERMPGIDSGVGIRAADDIQARRHVHPQRGWERFHIDVARLIARCNDDAAKDDPDYTVMAQTKRGHRDYIHSIKWRDVQLDEDDARLQVFPTSGLSTTPKGRRDDVMGLLQAGMIDQQGALDLLDLPDLDTETQDRLAEIDYARWAVEQVMDGKEIEPDPILGAGGLQLCLDVSRTAYLQLLYSEAPEEVLDAVRDYMERLKVAIELLTPKQPPAPPVDPSLGAPAAAPVEPAGQMPALAPTSPVMGSA